MEFDIVQCLKNIYDQTVNTYALPSKVLKEAKYFRSHKILSIVRTQNFVLLLPQYYIGLQEYNKNKFMENIKHSIITENILENWIPKQIVELYKNIRE